MPRKPVYDFELDDSDDDSVDDVGDSTQEIYDHYMEDISEILARAYDEIGAKVQALVDDLELDD